MIQKIIHAIASFFSHKLVIIAVMILLQLALFISALLYVSDYFVLINALCVILSIIACIYVVNNDDNPTYKMSWIMMIMVVPVVGGVLYVAFGGVKAPKALTLRDKEAQEQKRQLVNINIQAMKQLEKKNPQAYKYASYLWHQGCFPLYENSETTYFDSGEAKFEAMKKELKQAKRYIFLEYFIIGEGRMWQEVLDILKQKVNEGVDVRVLYDDFGCCTTLPDAYYEYLKKFGIKAKAFNTLKARPSASMNLRDHRKILVVDGCVAITGGINLADEYINERLRFGHWKDSAVMIKGEGVWSFTLMFLQFWNFDEENKDDLNDYRPQLDHIYQNDGYVLPYCDAPTDDENVGENTHLNMINSANKYIYATTPYLVIDYEMKQALCQAAKSGVDVRIITPHIPDKKYVFAVTRSNYKELIKAGVRIYEYTPGFIHAKNMVCDDIMGCVGTVNMDYRSYYLHYECGVWMYESKAVLDIKKDFIETMKVSNEVTMEDIKKTPFIIKIVRNVLNIFSPLF